jgi:hypothetical protein
VSAKIVGTFARLNVGTSGERRVGHTPASSEAFLTSFLYFLTPLAPYRGAAGSSAGGFAPLMTSHSMSAISPKKAGCKMVKSLS